MHVAERLSTAVELGAKRRVTMELEIERMAGGSESRNRLWNQFLFEFEVAYPISRRDASRLQSVSNAFLATGGGEHSFDFKDWRDSSAANEPLGIGDGTESVFPLVKAYAFGPVSHVRRVYRPVSAIIVKADAVVLSSGFTVDYDLGIVTFDAPPDPDVELTWSGDFNVPVRFDGEQVSEAVTTQNEHLDSVTLFEVRLSESDFE